MRLVYAWLPAAAYMGLIWFLSSIPHQFDLSHVPFRDKGVHVVEYAVLGALLAFAFRHTWPRLSGLRFYLAAALPGALFGYTDELHQAFVPGRFSSATDLLADVIGTVLGVAAFLLIERAALRLRRGRG